LTRENAGRVVLRGDRVEIRDLGQSKEDDVRLPYVLRTVVAVGLCLLLAIPSTPQGPSKGQAIAIIAGAAAVVTGVGILIYYGTRKASIAGCVTSDQNVLSLTNEKDKKKYVLSGGFVALQPGQQVVLKGKKKKDSGGKLTFQVQKLVKSYGGCKASP
jgi:hypothetical protein